MCWMSWGHIPQEEGEDSLMDLFKQIWGEDVRALVFHLQHVWTDWFAKIVMAFTAFFGLDHAGYYGDVFFINLLVKLMILDLAFGCWDAARHRCWNPKIFFVHGICKFPVYGFYLFLVASGDGTLERIYGKELPILELFIAYLIVAEIYSILKYAHYIGFYVPEILLWFSFGFRKKVEKKIKEVLPDGDFTADKTSDQIIREQEAQEKGNAKDSSNAV